uniref:Uncharacterized protein n=1 Tax=Mimivirus LCMiAC01 TaxID=2506608 RepID=A0A481Z0E4_9VIRU|nr:MAG: uncharacterized protein LCMiAC01_03090 [Mimivirus LCMiAC01]
MDSDLDFGVQNINREVSVVNLSEIDGKCVDKNTVIPDGKIKNPLHISINGGSLVTMEQRDIYINYKRVLILCLRSEIQDCNQPEHCINTIWDILINRDDYNECGKYLTLVPASMAILKNSLHKRNAVTVDRQYLLPFNNGNIELENDEIVVCMYDVDDKTVSLYLSLYENSTDINTVTKLMIMRKNYRCSHFNYIINKNLSKIINNSMEFEYWQKKYNCKLNINEVFINRTFRHNEKQYNTTKVSIIASNTNKCMQEMVSKMSTQSDQNYLDFIYRKNVYTDAALAAKKHGRTYYRVVDQEQDITKAHIEELFTMTNNKKELYDLFNMIAISKKHCHLVINNSNILEKMQPLFNEYMPIYKYIFGYAWLYMYMEECIIKTRTTSKKRYVFDINTANKLPHFPYCSTDVHMNPYITLLVNQRVLNSPKNCHSIAMIKNYKDYGIDTLEGFKRKFNIFTTGQDDKNIFDGLETENDSDKWKNFAVSGSLMPTCIEKRNPLTETLPKYPSNTEMWNAYFEKFHKNSDIDFICTKTKTFPFLDEVQKLITVVEHNLDTMYGSAINTTVSIEPTKNLLVLVHQLYLEKIMAKKFESVDYIIKNFNSNEIKLHFYAQYIKSKENMNPTLRQKYNIESNPLYDYYYKVASIDNMTVYLSEYENIKTGYKHDVNEECLFLNDILDENSQVPPEKNILILKISDSIKFKIKSPHLKHDIEVFKIKYDEIFSCVSRFHLPCVRTYYDGNNVYMLPSCVTSIMTHINIDYKYFASRKDPITIINKYRIRGFGTMLNDKERKHMVTYNGNVDEWKKKFDINIEDASTIKAHLGPRKLTDKMFSPENLGDIQNKQYIITTSDLYDSYADKCGYNGKRAGIDFLKYKTINKMGEVEPFKPWLLEAAYDELCLANAVSRA